MALIDRVPESVQKTLKPRTIELLKATREPRNAYIVLEKTKVLRMTGTEKKTEVTTGLAFLNVEDQADQAYNLRDLVLARGAKVICYGNFPSAQAMDNLTLKKYQVYSNPDELNPWDKMKDLCDTFLGKELEVSELIQAERDKNATLTKQLEALIKEKENGNSRQNATSNRSSTPKGESITKPEPETSGATK